MIFNSNTATKYTFDLAQSKANYERKEAARKKLSMYYDEQLPYLYDRLAAHFSDPDRFSLLNINIVRKIVDGLAAVYFEPARRIVSTKKDHELYTKIAYESDLDLKMKQGNRLSKLLGTCMLKVNWRNGRIALDMLTPDILDVQTGNSPEDVQAVTICYYPESNKQNEIYYIKWTANRISRLNYNLKETSNRPNPYGQLPIIPIWDSLPLSDFWLDRGQSLVAVQEAINERLTDLCYVLRMQSFAVPVLKGGSELSTFDPGQAINLPAEQHSDFSYAAPNAPIKATLDSIDYMIKSTAISYGLPPSYLSNKPSERKSGVSRLIENKELAEKRQDDIALFRKYETQVFNVIKTVWNYHNTNKFSKDSSISIDFAEPQSLNASEQAENWKTLIELGILSPVDCILRLNPDLKREDAEQIYQRNRGNA